LRLLALILAEGPEDASSLNFFACLNDYVGWKPDCAAEVAEYAVDSSFKIDRFI
jgi:hypothetical protein